LKLVPDNPFTLGLQAHLLHMLSQYAEAVPIFQRALSADPTQDWVYPELGFDLIMLGQYEEALKVLDNGLARQPQDIASLLSLRGEALRYLNRYEEALPNIEQALTLRPDNPFLLGWQGELLSLLGRNQEALAPLERAYELDKVQWIFAALSVVRLALERYDDLLNMLEQALAQQPNDAFALEVKGDVLRRLGRYDAAVEAFDRLLSV